MNNIAFSPNLAFSSNIALSYFPVHRKSFQKILHQSTFPHESLPIFLKSLLSEPVKPSKQLLLSLPLTLLSLNLMPFFYSFFYFDISVTFDTWSFLPSLIVFLPGILYSDHFFFISARSFPYPYGSILYLLLYHYSFICILYLSLSLSKYSMYYYLNTNNK